MTTHTAAAGIGLPKSTIRPIASEARQLFHLIDSAVEKLCAAPPVPEICRLQKDLGPLLGTSRDLAQNAVVSLEMDRDYETVMQPLRPMSGAKLADIEFDMLNLRNADRVVSMIFDETVAGVERDNGLVEIVRRNCPQLADREVLVMSEDEFNALLYSVFHLSEVVKRLYGRYHALIDGDDETEQADAA